ncbi:MAG: hypothetical protein HF978_18600 [Desulfobacteraceae bacterium]|nr:hypothetical protein [Desulfobacteraceae bacterium]MBC2757559.1 hypothetical protein [Desulfobacteraceae bacterium]
MEKRKAYHSYKNWQGTQILRKEEGLPRYKGMENAAQPKAKIEVGLPRNFNLLVLKKREH